MVSYSSSSCAKECQEAQAGSHKPLALPHVAVGTEVGYLDLPSPDLHTDSVKTSADNLLVTLLFSLLGDDEILSDA